MKSVMTLFLTLVGLNASAAKVEYNCGLSPMGEPVTLKIDDAPSGSFYEQVAEFANSGMDPVTGIFIPSKVHQMEGGLEVLEGADGSDQVVYAFSEIGNPGHQVIVVRGTEIGKSYEAVELKLGSTANIDLQCKLEKN